MIVTRDLLAIYEPAASGLTSMPSNATTCARGLWLDTAEQTVAAVVAAT